MVVPWTVCSIFTVPTEPGAGPCGTYRCITCPGHTRAQPLARSLIKRKETTKLRCSKNALSLHPSI
jgi:hypothetical protein